MAGKSWNQKLNGSPDLPRIQDIGPDSPMARRMGSGRMLIAAPVEYDQVMKLVPSGQLTTSGEIRSCLASRHGADFTCPLTAGIFINIAAHASSEREAFGQGDLTPWWRTLKKDGELNEKYPGGIAGQQKHLEAEGHAVIKRGARCFVENYQQKLCQLS